MCLLKTESSVHFETQKHLFKFIPVCYHVDALKPGDCIFFISNSRHAIYFLNISLRHDIKLSAMIPVNANGNCLRWKWLLKSREAIRGYIIYFYVLWGLLSFRDKKCQPKKRVSSSEIESSFQLIVNGLNLQGWIWNFESWPNCLERIVRQAILSLWFCCTTFKSWETKRSRPLVS